MNHRETLIDISGLDPAAVLHALYMRAIVGGPTMAGLDMPRIPLTLDGARELIDGSIDGSAEFSVRRPLTQDLPQRDSDGRLWFQFLYGCPLKIRLPLDGGLLDTAPYDRDNGTGAAAEAIAPLRAATP